MKDQTNGGYDTALIGKWHLSNTITDPNSMGVDYYSGIIGGGVSSYTNWNRVTNGERERVTTYTTTELSNQAVKWISQRSKPWFLWLAYNAPHTPFHLAPTNLHNQGNLSEDEAMIEETLCRIIFLQSKPLTLSWVELLNQFQMVLRTLL